MKRSGARKIISVDVSASKQLRNFSTPRNNFEKMKTFVRNEIYICSNFWFNYKFLGSRLDGSGCSTAVERMSCNREVVGLNPTGCWAFFPSLSSQQVPPWVPREGVTLLISLSYLCSLRLGYRLDLRNSIK